MANLKKAKILRMLYCDFCGASQESALLMIQGRDEVHICETCVGVCARMVLSENDKQAIKVAPLLCDEPQP